ncbi:DJ-1/PfpI family protein [Bradyrhizobium sp. BWA-3-5]|uniref:DJ-1/PfpI family protein n=1 Tax=Bradyrhizobium sp. BWA-3-5 TaxID=3080013 RepID=UPI00293EDEEC|nr:DJ-1/PfpI family protein [Bradyrhizobium sp. BWA-3-5]WOH64580.1 DJ-1/PfpI family protein [Bradyrhizobium sp. BWA-3-5]
MTSRRLLWSALGTVALLLIVGGGWLWSLPPAPVVAPPPPIAQAERDATVAALKPPKRQRPLIAIIGINDGTETTDYLMPYGILRRADVADVITLATKPGPVQLYPVLKVEPQATIAEFDAQHPDGADYVIVPAMIRDDDPVALQWMRNQSARGAIIVGVCVGAKVVGEAGLLHNKRATTHWYSVKELRSKHPTMQYVRDRRFVVDDGVATTTGISASMPISLGLIEAIAGHDKARAVGRDIGVADWDARHESDAFRFTRPFALTAIGNTATFWAHERLGIELKDGVDEVSLALAADAWSRTYRSQAVTFAATADARQSRGGLRIYPEEVAASWPAERLPPSVGERKPADALDDTLRAMTARYGAHTTDFVAMQLEYPRNRAAP